MLLPYKRRPHDVSPTFPETGIPRWSPGFFHEAHASTARQRRHGMRFVLNAVHPAQLRKNDHRVLGCSFCLHK